MLMKFPVKELKQRLKEQVYAEVTIWVDTEQNLHVRFDDKFFSIGVNLPIKYWSRLYLHIDKLSLFIIKSYKSQLLEKFIKD